MYVRVSESLSHARVRNHYLVIRRGEATYKTQNTFSVRHLKLGPLPAIPPIPAICTAELFFLFLNLPLALLRL